MKLKTSLQISAVFPLALAIIVSLGLYGRARAINKAREGIKASETLLTQTVELNTAMHACLLSPSPAAQRAWESQYLALEEALAGFRSDDFLQNSAADDMRRRHKELGQNVSKLIEFQKAGRTPAEKLAMSADEVAVLENKLSQEMREMQRSAFKLITAGNASTAVMEDAVDTYFMILVGVLALAMAALTMIASRNLMLRLKSMKDAADSAANGGAYTLEAGGHDEMGEAIRAVGGMIGRLRKSQDGQAEHVTSLEKEVARLKGAADAARDSNMRLADALTRLKRAQQQAVQQERILALKQVVRGISRDFAGALTPILSTSDFLLSFPDRLAKKDEVVEDLKLIHASAEKARKQIALLLDVFLSPEQEGTQSVDVNLAVEKAVQATESRWNAPGMAGKIRCETHLGSGVPLVAGHEHELTEAIVNLIINAVEALPRGGTIRLTTQGEGDWVKVSVRDDGEGMTEDVRIRCMEPFFSTKGGGSSGMGLTLVMVAAGRNGGALDIESSPEKGATFTLTLPVRKASDCVPEKPPSESAPGRSLACLVIDDELWIRKMMTKVLTAEGHTVETSANGLDGIERSSRKHYDLVILDRALPDMAGEDVAKLLRNQRPDLPIILLTGFGDMMKEQDVRLPGISVILSKPTTLKELREAIARSLSSSPA